MVAPGPTDLADLPAQFWIEPGQNQHLVYAARPTRFNRLARPATVTKLSSNRPKLIIFVSFIE